MTNTTTAKVRVDWTAIRRIAQRGEAPIRRALVAAIAGIRNGTRIAAVQAALNRGDLDGAVAAVPWRMLEAPAFRAQMMSAMRATFEAAGVAAPRVTPSLPPQPFDVLNPRGLAAVRDRGASLVADITNTTRAGLRMSLETMLHRGLSAQHAARLIRPQIGLFDRWAVAVQNHHASLTARGLPEATVTREAERYAAQLLQARALMIARTEASFLVHAGVREYWDQSADEGLFDRQDAVREWVAVRDGEGNCKCEEYDGMLIGYDADFPEGDPPIHPNCICDVLLWPRGKD